MNNYVSVTSKLPEVGTEAWTYNGETEFKNIYLGDGKWQYQLKYPITHWVEKIPLPTQDKVDLVSKQLKAQAVA